HCRAARRQSPPSRPPIRRTANQTGNMETATTNATVTTIRELGGHVGESVTIRGWLYNLRESGKLLFPIFRDGTGLVQGVVAKNAVPLEVFEQIKNLTQESS